MATPGKDISPGRARELGLGRGNVDGNFGYDPVRGSPDGFPGAGQRYRQDGGDKLPALPEPKKTPLPY